MKLVEVVVGDNTSDATRDAASTFARQVGKLPVLVRDRPGFFVNRVLFPYLLDAAESYESGIDVPEEIDRPLTVWGMPMGPLRLIDEIGVDITVDIAATLEKAYGRRDKANQLLQKMRRRIGWDARLDPVFTNTKAKRKRLTIHWRNGVGKAISLPATSPKDSCS